jgi:phosphatidate cytidylyltransferase
VKRVLTAVILIPIVVLALFRAPLWLFALLVLGVALLAAREYFDIAEATGYKPSRFLGYFLLVLSFVVLCGLSEIASIDIRRPYLPQDISAIFVYGVAAFVLLAPLLFFLESMQRESLSRCLPDGAVSYAVLPYIGFTLVLLPLLRATLSGPVFVLFLMLVVWSGDIAAYYVGRAIGKHKLAPRISPAKTWEGAIASTIGSVAVAIVLFHYSAAIISALTRIGLLQQKFRLYAPASGMEPYHHLQYPFMFALVFAVAVNVAAQLGDLFESAIKRGAGVKDSGTLLPGHGGVLDRIDALLFALPAGFFLYTFMH